MGEGPVGIGRALETIGPVVIEIVSGLWTVPEIVSWIVSTWVTESIV